MNESEIDEGIIEAIIMEQTIEGFATEHLNLRSQLRREHLTDVSPLAELKQLQAIYPGRKTSLSNKAIEKLQKALTNCSLA